jgi:hypothetical protein
MFKLTSRQEGKKTEDFLKKAKELQIESVLNKYGSKGVQALAAATPVDSGRTASSWGYELERTGNGWSIHWTNDNINQNVNIAVILQYGHGTGTGGYVAGRDYINPAIAPIFEEIANEAWKEITTV